MNTVLQKALPVVFVHLQVTRWQKRTPRTPAFHSALEGKCTEASLKCHPLIVYVRGSVIRYVQQAHPQSIVQNPTS